MAELLNVQDLRVHFHIAAKGRNAVDGVSFSLEEGEILGLVGESGSGKSVTAMSISGLLPRRQAEVSGSIKLGGREILQCPEEELRKIQGDDLAVVFQEPMTSLNPVLRIGPQVEESLRVHARLSPEARRQRALEAMIQAELPDPESLYRKYPHELSGGMLQRVMIASAISSGPKLLLADDRPGRDHSNADSRAAEKAESGTRHGDFVHQPQPARGAEAVYPGGCDAGGTPGGDRPGAGYFPKSQAGIHQTAHRRDSHAEPKTDLSRRRDGPWPGDRCWKFGT